MQIVPFPHPALRFKSVDVQQIDGTLRAVIQQMFQLMYSARGIGLAANQVGLPFRFFIVNLAGRPDGDDEELVFINPVIRRRKGSEAGEEGCLSLPGLYADVSRSTDVVIEAFDLEGQGFEMEAEDLAARVVQHELDHLDGVMFTDKLADNLMEAEIQLKLKKFELAFAETLNAGQLAQVADLQSELQRMASAGLIPADFLERPNVNFTLPKIGKVQSEAPEE